MFLDSGTVSQYDLTADIVPLHDDCAGALSLGAGTVGFSNVGATTDGPGELGLCSFAGDSQVQSDVWYRFFAQCTGQATVSLCGSGFDTKIAVYGASCPTGPGEVIVCNNDACGLQSEVTFAVVENTFYRLRIGGHQGAQGLGTMTITCTDVLPCPWDLNGDGVVNVLDLIELVMSFGPCENCPADFDDDGFVNVLDLIPLIMNFGPCPGTPCGWDVNGDGVVDQSDVQAVTGNLGPCEDPENCPWDVNSDGVVNGQDVQAVATHFGPCP